MNKDNLFILKKMLQDKDKKAFNKN